MNAFPKVSALFRTRGASTGAVIFLLFILAPPVSAAPTVRDEFVDASYELVYLKWNDGKGQLTWDPLAPTAALGGPATAPGGSGLPVAEFVSGPTPRTLFVNATRMVQFDLYLTGCDYYSSDQPPQMDVELWAGSEFLTGGINGIHNRIGWGSQDGQSPDPDVPNNYCIRQFRMPAYFDIVPAGSTLKLRVLLTSQATNQFGVKGTAQSILRVPTFASDEAIFRFPGLDDAKPSTAPSAGTEHATSQGWVAPLALIVLLAGTRPSAARPPALGAAMLLVVATAGCMSPFDAGPDAGPASASGFGGSYSAEEIDDASGSTGLANRTHGSIAGRIHDDEGYPVPGAQVALLGTKSATTSGRAGQFVLNGISPGTYRLRIVREAYKAFEGPVAVAVEKITRIEVTMEPLVRVESDQRLHRHDYWDGKDRVTLVDETLPEGATDAYIPFPKLVLPGTRRLEISVSWDFAGLEDVTVGFMGNHEAMGWSEFNASHTYYLKSGGLATIAITSEMADAGHQKRTTWGKFFIVPFRDEQGWEDFLFEYGAPLEQPVFTIQAVAVRGLVPLEPPHRDFWGTKSNVTVMKAQPSLAEKGYYAVSPSNYSWTPGSIIPPGTSRLEILLKQDRPLVAGTTDYRLSFRTAQIVPNMYNGYDPSGYAVCRGQDPAKARPATLVSKDATKLEWRFSATLGPDDSDPFYAKRSMWCFWAEPTDPITHDTDWQWYFWAGIALGRDMLELDLTVDALRDPPLS